MNIDTINIVSKTFNYRHDFFSDDLDYLKSKYSNIEFKNIPEAWIIVLDDFLQKHHGVINCVQQYFGYLSVIYKDDISIDVKRDQEYTEKRLKKIDLDLFDIEGFYDMEN